MSGWARAFVLVLAATAAALNVSGCVAADGGGYYDGGGAYYAGGYYEPFEYGYGGWGRNYHVGPGRGGARGSDRGGHAYRAAPAGRGSPSMPHRSGKR